MGMLLQVRLKQSIRYGLAGLGYNYCRHISGAKALLRRSPSDLYRTCIGHEPDLI